MQTEIITSRANPHIKAAAALSAAKERARTGLFMTEGARLCADAAQNGAVIKEFYFTAEASEKYREKYEIIASAAQKGFIINGSVAEKLSDTSATQEMFCVCEIPSAPAVNKLKADGLYIMTENLQSPDNLGAVSRTAEALGFDGMIVSGGCDIYSPKALRASMGALIRFPVICPPEISDFLGRAKSVGMKIFATSPLPSAQKITETDKTGGCILIVGNEGNGITDTLFSEATDIITIPMRGRAESLNASAAAAVAMWEFVRDRV